MSGDNNITANKPSVMDLRLVAWTPQDAGSVYGLWGLR